MKNSLIIFGILFVTYFGLDLFLFFISKYIIKNRFLKGYKYNIHWLDFLKEYNKDKKVINDTDEKK